MNLYYLFHNRNHNCITSELSPINNYFDSPYSKLNYRLTLSFDNALSSRWEKRKIMGKWENQIIIPGYPSPLLPYLLFFLRVRAPRRRRRAMLLPGKNMFKETENNQIHYIAHIVTRLQKKGKNGTLHDFLTG